MVKKTYNVTDLEINDNGFLYLFDRSEQNKHKKIFCVCLGFFDNGKLSLNGKDLLERFEKHFSKKVD